MVFDFKENCMSKVYPQQSTKYDDKENEFKLPKLETNWENYETLVKKLNKLSADEQNIRNKLITHSSEVCFYF